MPFFHIILPVEIAKIKPRETLSHQNRKIIERSMTSRHHGSTNSGWQQNQRRRRRKKNGKKVKRFYWQNNKFARASRYFVHFFAVVAPLRHETS